MGIDVEPALRLTTTFGDGAGEFEGSLNQSIQLSIEAGIAALEGRHEEAAAAYAAVGPRSPAGRGPVHPRVGHGRGGHGTAGMSGPRRRHRFTPAPTWIASAAPPCWPIPTRASPHHPVWSEVPLHEPWHGSNVIVEIILSVRALHSASFSWAVSE